MTRVTHLAILVILAVAALPPLRGQTAPAWKTRPAPVEVTLAYSSNRGTGSTYASFWMQGGKAEFSAAFTRNFSLVGELAAQHVGNINSVGQNLGLVTYLFGPRYSYREFRRFTPFAQALVGGVHPFDAYFPNAINSSQVPDAFVWSAGGGINVAVSRRLAIRAIQADYLQTQLPNDAANRENNLRLAAGLVFLFGASR